MSLKQKNSHLEHEMANLRSHITGDLDILEEKHKVDV